jgi:hypothetical protein
MKVIKVNRLDEGAVPSTSTIPTKHTKDVFYGGEIGLTDIRNCAGENRSSFLK